MLYGLIGYPLGHSFSEKYFTSKFKNEGIDATYSLFPLPSIDDLPDLLKSHKDLKGFNVTIPYKQEVMDYIDILSEDASEIGAVNVVKINEGVGDTDKYLCGYNTDYIGFTESLRPLLTDEMKKALILGTGGASKAVAYSLDRLGIDYKFVSRVPGEDELGYDELSKEIMSESLLIVNTTPLGMFPKTENAPDIPYNLLGPAHLCYDLVYNPEITEFMKRSANAGAKVKNGLEMLHLQAEAAWKIWNE